MEWCPIAKEESKKEKCAWFSEGECAFARLHDVADKLETLDDIVGSLESLERTIKTKNFTE